MFRIAAYANFLIATLHLLVFVDAEKVFSLTGVGDKMMEHSQIHPMIPYLLSILVMIFFVIFGLYGLSAQGDIKRLPLLKFAIFAIGGIYALRGIGGIVKSIVLNEPLLLYTYSIVALAIGLLFLIGGLKKWHSKIKV